MKKFAALFLALVLALSMSSVAFAYTDGYEEVVTGDGQTVYINTTVYSVVLPTAGAFDFKLDPLGLTNVTASVDFSTLKGGKIISGNPMPIINNSSVPLKISVELAAVAATTGTLTGVGSTPQGATFVYSTSAVTEATKANVLLYAAPSSTDIRTASVAYTPTAQAVVIAATPSNTKIEFALPAANYKVVATAGGTDYVMKIDPNTGHGTALKIGGIVNSDADWSEFTDTVNYSVLSTLGLQVKFTLKNDKGSTYDYASSGNSVWDTTTKGYGLLANTATKAVTDFSGSTATTYAAAGFISGSSTVKTISASGTAGQWADIPFYYDGKNIASVTVNGSAVAEGTSYQKGTGNVLQVKIGSAGSKTVVVKLSGDTNSYTLTFNVA